MSTVTPPRVVRHRRIEAPAPDVWAVLGRLTRHAALVPLTTVDAPDRELRVGDRVTAVTAEVVVDRMVVTAVRRRGEDPTADDWARWATLHKEGPLLVGDAHLVVRARGRHACEVLWAEDVRTTIAGAALEPFVDVALAIMSDRALARLDGLVARA
ncbi:hypothetical protein [Cellulomonas soli]|uniref:hypothetical protein n=1 Tax=Cellulomonas soli TaxID=931535 RepID=UPI0011BF0BA4|nr:hypothetical protein [Cellulomonas soli]NYI58313.1 hypothetical protein [Cellulomonas soli]